MCRLTRGCVPRSEAGIKVTRSQLGHDARWQRPKTKEETKQQIRALENSKRPVTRQPATQETMTTDLHQLDNNMVDLSGLGLYLETPLSAVSFRDFNHDWSSSPLSSMPTPDWQSYIPSGINAIPAQDEWPRPRRQDSALSTLSDGTVSSMTGSFVERLGTKGITPSEAGDLWKVVKRYTGPVSAPSSPSPSPPRAFPPGHKGFPSADMPISLDESRSGYAIAGDFINLGPMFSFETHTTCDRTSEAHRDQKCWCILSQELLKHSQLNFRQSSDLVPNTEIVQCLDDINVAARDEFGHTPLHLLASRPDCQLQLLSVVADALTHGDRILGVVNTARQTFMHVLHPAWFQLNSPLEKLFSLLERSRFDVLTRDVFGRNVFHIMREHECDLERVQLCAHGLNPKAVNTRDAFRRKPLQLLPSGSRQHMLRTVRQIMHAQRLMTLTVEQPGTESESRVLTHTKLINIIGTATSTEPDSADPSIEDPQGRNGLHALAELILGVDPMIDYISRGQKRKRDTKDVDQPKQEVMPRVEHLEALIHAKADINHYNLAGYTPLMAFVVQLSEGKTKEDITELREVIGCLVKAGADMEKRNRRGETALLLAARHGKKVAVDALLKLGANPYVRNADGESILDVVDSMWLLNADIRSSYDACRKFLIGSSLAKTKQRQDPSIFDEWAFGLR